MDADIVKPGWSLTATVLQTPTPHHLDVREQQRITVINERIDSIIDDELTTARPSLALPDNWVLVPGLIDTHLHAPQWPQLGTGLDLPLDEWLFERTFPLEARFVDDAFAEQVWAHMVPTLLRAGTTTAVYYGSIHETATITLAATCVAAGQRAFVGRVAMDHPTGTPDWYRDPSPTASVDASARVVEAIEALPGAAGLVAPIITPRFIPACTDAALSGHAELAEATGARVQTHCSEGDWQHAHVLDRCGRSDTHALAEFGLLRDHTVLAHATHLSDDDRSEIIERGSGVAHCPLSNSYFANAVFPARRNLDAGMRIGLGTDVAGGATSSMFAQCGHAVTSSRMLEDGVDVRQREGRGVAQSRIDVVTAFHMATAGGADLLGLEAGRLVAGNVFDAVAIDTSEPSLGINPDIDDWPRVFEKIVRGPAERAIRAVWVGGRLVVGDLSSCEPR